MILIDTAVITAKVYRIVADVFTTGGENRIMFLISNVVVCVCAYVSFIYGTIKFFGRKKAVYAQMITLAVGCTAFGKLYQVIRLLTVGDIFNEFQLGLLGMIGSLAFLFSANFGVMDSLADDGSKKYLKYRIFPLALPAAEIAIYVIHILCGDFAPLIKVTAGAITLFAAGASYFNLKHLIFPDVDFGVIKCLKLYNFLAVLFAFLCIAQIAAYSYVNETAAVAVDFATGVVMLLMTPAVERGLKKWKT